MAKKLFLIDGMALSYRAYFSMIRTPLINSKGMNTSAIYGFINSLNKILQDENPTILALHSILKNQLSGTKLIKITKQHAKRCRMT